MKIANLKKVGTTLLLTPALLIGTLPAGAQELHRRGDDRDSYRQRDYREAHRDYGRERYGYRDSGYVTYAPAYGYAPAPAYGYGHDDRIGPGKGAAIGAVSGAVLGALVGGGKGAVIGGAAGAGVGAIAGQAAQDNRNRQYGYYGR